MVKYIIGQLRMVSVWTVSIFLALLQAIGGLLAPLILMEMVQTTSYGNIAVVRYIIGKCTMVQGKEVSIFLALSIVIGEWLVVVM